MSAVAPATNVRAPKVAIPRITHGRLGPLSAAPVPGSCAGASAAAGAGVGVAVAADVAVGTGVGEAVGVGTIHVFVTVSQSSACTPRAGRCAEAL